MEFGMMGLEGLVSSGTGFASSDHEKQKCCGSAGFLKQEDVDDGCRASKIAKVRDDLSTSVSKGSSIANFSEDGQQHHNMLSFSSSKLEDFSLKCSGGLDIKNLQKSAAFPTYFQHPTSPYTKISGYSCTGGGGLNASMYMLSGVKGPFTPGQWIELEQQALIYKYIISNEPIPPTLLLPIRRALESAGFFSFPGGLLRPNSYGWGPFHLGFSNSTDPEPGRCRRTDGKKWRCSREAVPDQKYCERHMNRGRHRSRKPVEGRSSGRSVSGSTPTTTKLTNPSSPAALVVPAGATSNSFAPDHTASSLVDRLLVSKQNGSQETQGATGLNCLSSSINLNSNASTFSILEDQIPFTESLPMSLGVLTSDALYRTYSSTHDVNAPEPDPQHLACSFRGDFMSSTSSPTREGVAISPLRISGELEMGLGVTSERTQKHSNWVPISWETSMGGPLGEALKTTSNSSESHSRNVSSALNLLSKGWDGSPQLAASSPTGVLQRTPLGSLSNSSAGSSPRADNGRGLESGSLCVDNIGPTLGN